MSRITGRLGPGRFRPRRGGIEAGFGHLLGAEHLAVGAITADFGAGDHDLKAEGGFDLAAEALQHIAEKLFHLAATEADDMGVLLLRPGLVVVLIAAIVHEVQLIHQAAFFQQFQGAVHGDAVQFRVPLLRHAIEAFGIEVLAGLVDQFEQQLALAGEADATLLERVFGRR